jgi:acyl-CoA dehydrogenase
MTLPRRYGGAERSYVERYVVTEELLRASAPVAAHWLADRQVGPTILRYGNDRLRVEVLPGICRGEIYFCLGLSEPDTGSDVSSVSLRAEQAGNGWTLHGTKIWTTYAEFAHYIYVIARTSREENRHAGLTEFVVPLDSPGVTVRPIEDLSGAAHFNEVIFDGVHVPSWRVVGEIGRAWTQIVSQLDFERAGPERFLSTFPLFEALASQIHARGDDHYRTQIGELASTVVVLRTMSQAVAQEMDRSGPPGTLAASVKDLGTEFEQQVGEVALSFMSEGPRWRSGASALERLLTEALTFGPAFTVRGGTTEILRGIIARRELHLGAK